MKFPCTLWLCDCGYLAQETDHPFIAGEQSVQQALSQAMTEPWRQTIQEAESNEPWRPAEVLQTQLHDLLQQMQDRLVDVPVGQGRQAFRQLAFNARMDLGDKMEYWANMLRRLELEWGLNKYLPWTTASGAPGEWSSRAGGAAEWLEAEATVPTELGPRGFVAMLKPEVPETSEAQEGWQGAWEVQWQDKKAERYKNEKKSKGAGRGKRGAASSQDEEWLSEPGDVGLDTGAAITAFPSPPSPPSPPSRSSQRHVRIWTAL